MSGADRIVRRPPAQLRVHPDAERVPEMAPDEYEAVVADIAERGVTTPLDVTPRGVVLDGRHRLRAAQDAGLSDVPVRIVCPEDEVEHIILAAVQRRHLTVSQRATLALELATYRQERERAKGRRLANLNGSADVATLPPRGGRTRELAARLAGVSPRTVQNAIRIQEADPQLFEAVKAGSVPVNKAVKQLERRAKYATLAPASALPDGPFEVIYADPAWPSQGPGSAWSPEQHYQTMPVEAIKALQIPTSDCALLFLWAVNGRLPDALAVMEAWGFSYKTCLVWVKPSIGLGFWTRNRHELLLLGLRGNVQLPDEADRPDSVIEAPRGRHSEKPACVYELIERMYPGATRLELFARTTRSGWTAWGNEVAACEPPPSLLAFRRFALQFLIGGAHATGTQTGRH